MNYHPTPFRDASGAEDPGGGLGGRQGRLVKREEADPLPRSRSRAASPSLDNWRGIPVNSFSLHPVLNEEKGFSRPPQLPHTA